MKPLLSVSQLTKTFGGRRAVDQVSFSVQPGQTLGLLGPNGAGKSTTVGMICGLLRPDSGSVTLDGEAVGPGANSAKRKIGFVPQDLALYEDLPAIDNLKLFAALYGIGGAELKRRSEEVLALVNLSDRARDKPATFSGGMKRRLNIAAALMHDPALLILDEPTVGVDPQSRNAIFDTLESIQASGRSLIYTSHYMEEVERLADHIVIIDHGRVLADESPQALYQRLPAQAALEVEGAAAFGDEAIALLERQDGVSGVARAADGTRIEIALRSGGDAAPVLAALQAHAAAHGPAIIHFATARTKLEGVFLNLTGRSLRD